MIAKLKTGLSFPGTLRQWHWVSAAVCLAGMLLFAVTGITLNHAADIAAEPRVVSLEASVPTSLLQNWNPEQQPSLPGSVRKWLAESRNIHIRAGLAGEWQGGEFYLPMPRPGGDAWLALNPNTGELLYESSDRGWIAWANDLHKGRHTGLAWRVFIDVVAVACIVFCLSGLLLLKRQASGRHSTWPLTTLGLVVPLVLILLFIH